MVYEVHGDGHDEHHDESKLFNEVNALRKGGKEVDQDAIDNAKLNDSVFGRLAKNKVFEYTTLSVIVLNAMFIGYDGDFSARFRKPDNLYDCGSFEPDQCYQFTVFENFFAVYFTAEVIIRFFAYKYKSTSLTDAWFVFDSILVLFMVVETWVLPIVGASGPLAQLSVLRLLRLLRITRMAKLMRFFPELQIIVKGMIAAVRSVMCTAILLIGVLYVFSILFTSEFHQGQVLDEDQDEFDAKFLFGGILKSMRYLFIMGTILDDITLCCNNIRGSEKGYMIVAFVAFVLISSFTMLNMLIGILCEVVCATGEGQRNQNTEANVRDAITTLFSSMDTDNNGLVTRDEFLMMKSDKGVMIALKDLEVKPKHFEMYADLMFKSGAEDAASSTKDLEPEAFSFDAIVSMILRLRPGSKVSALDFATFQTTMYSKSDKIRHHIDEIEKMACILTGKDLVSESRKLILAGGNSQAGVGADADVVELQLQRCKSSELTLAPPPFDKAITDQAILVELRRRLGLGPFKRDVKAIEACLGGFEAIEACHRSHRGQAGGLGGSDYVDYQSEDDFVLDGKEWSEETYTC